MKILFFCPRWGQVHTPWNIFLKTVKAAGYVGIEASLPENERETAEMLEGLAKYSLAFIGQHWQTVAADPVEHYNEMDTRLHQLAEVKPLFINSQTGRDHFSFEENKKLLLRAKDIADKTGVAIIHETHRGKFSFAAHVTKQFLKEMPALRITLDISHCSCPHSRSFLFWKRGLLSFYGVGNQGIDRFNFRLA